MNKDEMINNIATSIGLACTSIELDLKDRQEIAKTLYILGCRKVGEDEIVIKKSEYEVQAKEIKRLYKELKKAQRELNVRKDFWEDDFEERIENYGKQYYELGKRDAAREILQKLKDNIMLADFGCGDGYEEVVDMNTDELKKLAKEKGIELED